MNRSRIAKQKILSDMLSRQPGEPSWQGGRRPGLAHNTPTVFILKKDHSVVVLSNVRQRNFERYMELGQNVNSSYLLTAYIAGVFYLLLTMLQLSDSKVCFCGISQVFYVLQTRLGIECVVNKFYTTNVANV